jgi:hypothetical protein
MKRCLLVVLLLTNCLSTGAQNLDSLYKLGKYQEIVAAYTGGGRSFNNNDLELVAAAYDHLGRLDEEDEVLAKLVNKFPLFLSYGIPCAYDYYGNFIKAGGMERFKTAISEAYLKSIKDTALGRIILNAYYLDQSVRNKYEDNKYRKKAGMKVKWDEAQLLKEWERIDSAHAPLIAKIIRDQKGYPSRTTIGLIGTRSLFILMQHLDVKWRDRYDQLLFQAACSKDINMDDFSMYKTMTLVRSHQIPDSAFQRVSDSLSALTCR